MPPKNNASARRPVTVTIVAIVFIAAGVVGLVYHTAELFGQGKLNYEEAWVLFLRALAIVIGLYLLRGANWARWLGLA